MSSDKKWSFRLQHILHAIEKIVSAPKRWDG